jgi:hypothetical protein
MEHAERPKRSPNFPGHGECGKGIDVNAESGTLQPSALIYLGTKDVVRTDEVVHSAVVLAPTMKHVVTRMPAFLHLVL